jgi:DNA-binding MarR family transcriptional regulator
MSTAAEAKMQSPRARPLGARRPSGAPTRSNVGFALAKASQRWNELLAEEFAAQGFLEVRPSYGSVLLPLFEEDGLRMGELATRSRLPKQTVTTLVRQVVEAGLATRRDDPADGRAARIFLTERAQAFAPVAGRIVGRLERRVAGRMTSREYRAFCSGLEAVIGL